MRVALIAALAVFLVPTAPPARTAPPAARTGCETPTPPQPVERVPGAGARVAVTFDEPLGPLTREILATLDRFRMSSTFYAVGREVRDAPARAKEIVAARHELGNHSWRHAELTQLIPAQVRRDLRRTNRVLRRVTGFRPCTFRPPGGVADEAVTREANALELVQVNWTTASDPFTDDPSKVCASALDGIVRGTIVLLHQVPHSAEALPCILRGLRDRGLRSVPVARLLGGDFTRARALRPRVGPRG